MSDINNIKEEVYKCSKCGLCKSVCPLFLSEKNEMFLPRGRYIVMNNYFNFSKKIDKRFISNLDICLNCNLCKSFCPSNIDAYNIFTSFKHHFHYKYSIVRFSLIYRLWLNIMRFFAFLYRNIFHPLSIRTTYFDNLFSVRHKKNHSKQIETNKKKVYYFEGCINKYINPSDKNASINLIEGLGYKVNSIISKCCGYPYLSEGNYEKYKCQIKSIIDSVPMDADYIICSCDTCFDTLKKASLFSDIDSKFLSKLITLDGFLKLNSYNPVYSENGMYFKPLLRQEDCYIESSQEQIRRKGICSLMENFFILKYPKLSKKIINSLFYSKDEVDGKTIYTTCQLSKLGLIKCFAKKKINAPVKSYSEYVLEQK